MTVVFDSNIWISALRFGGVPMVVLRAAYLRHTIACCNEIEVEVMRILRMKFDWDAKSAATMMNRYLDGALRIHISGQLNDVCRDANDNMVVECAILANAQFIVSGDKDLLSLDTYSGIRVLTPTRFLAQ